MKISRAFWDTSALVPLCVQQQPSPAVRQLLEQHTPGLRLVPESDADPTPTDVAPSDGAGCVTNVPT